MSGYITGASGSTNPQSVVWFCHCCGWSGVLPAGYGHRCTGTKP